MRTRKVVFEQNNDLIFVDDIKEDSIVLVVKKGKAFATIFVKEIDNCSVQTMHNLISNKSFMDIKKWCGSDCEFFVL